jgi:hypothetical protein
VRNFRALRRDLAAAACDGEGGLSAVSSQGSLSAAGSDRHESC